MKRNLMNLLAGLLVATVVFAHAGEVHSYLGTITTINRDGSFVMKLANGKNRTVLIAKSTTYEHSDGHKGKHSELIVGKRVSAKISKDGKTALSVKMSAPKKNK